MSKFGKIQRNSYKTSAELLSATGEDFDWDYEHYHDARSQLHDRPSMAGGWPSAWRLSRSGPIESKYAQAWRSTVRASSSHSPTVTFPRRATLGWKRTRDFKGPLAYVTIGYKAEIKEKQSETNKSLDLQVFKPTGEPR